MSIKNTSICNKNTLAELLVYYYILRMSFGFILLFFIVKTTETRENETICLKV